MSTTDQDYHQKTGTIVVLPTRSHQKSEKRYSDLSTPEKWEWHTDVYAFRAVCLGIVEQTSPCDPDGKWYDAAAVEREIRVKRDKRERAARAREREQEEMQREGRAIVDRWAQKQGFASMDEFCQAANIPWIDGYALMAQTIPGPKRMPGERRAPTAADMGVKAKEWTPEEMRAGRVALGLEDDAG